MQQMPNEKKFEQAEQQSQAARAEQAKTLEIVEQDLDRATDAVEVVSRALSADSRETDKYFKEEK